MPRKALTIATALVLVSAGGSAGPVAYATWTARAAVARLVAGGRNLSLGGMDVDLLGGRVTLHDVAAWRGPLRISARTVSLPIGGTGSGLIGAAVAQASERPFRVAQSPTPDGSKAPVPAAPLGTARATDVTVVDGATTYTIKTIDVAGTTLSNADLLALLDPKSADTLAARLQKLNASSVVIPDLRSETKTPGSTVRASVAQIALSGLAAGKIAAASATSSAVSATGERGGIDVKTGAIQASGLDLALLERMVDTTRQDDAEELKTLSDSLTINDLSLSSADKKAAVTVATLTQKGLKARPLKGGLSTLNRPDPPSAGDETPKAKRSQALLDDVSTSFAADSLTIAKMSVSNTEADGASRLAVAAVAFDGYRDRKLGAVRLSDFLFEGPSVRFGIGTMDLAGVAIPPFGRTSDAAASETLATDGLPAVAKGDITRIDVDAATPQDDGTVSKIKFKVAHVGSTSDQVIGQLPSQGALAVDHLTFDVPATDSPGARELLAMGYRAMDVSGALATAYDQKQQTLSVQKLLVSGVDMGSLTLALDFANVSKGILSASPAVARASALAMLLKRLDVHVANAGLIDRVLQWKATQDGRSPEEERSAAVNLFSVTLPDGLGGGPGIKAIGTAVAAFIADPHTLHVAARSKDGLGASDIGLIGAPAELLERLDIEAEANK